MVKRLVDTGAPRNASASAAKCLDLDNVSEEDTHTKRKDNASAEVSRLASFDRSASSGAQTTGYEPPALSLRSDVISSIDSFLLTTDSERFHGTDAR